MALNMGSIVSGPAAAANSSTVYGV
jgi:hypothetical protein